MLFHMLSQLAPDFRAFTIDTGVLFPQTLTTWKAFEERFGRPSRCSTRAVRVQPWTAENCCGQAKVAALEAGLSDVDAWITGLRREQAPTRAATPKVDDDATRGIVKLSPLADWTDKDVWRYIAEHDLPYNPLHDEGYDSIGCAPCTLPGSGRDGRWSGQEKTECGIHVVMDGAHEPPALRALAPRRARGRVDPHLPRGRRRVREPGAAVQRRQGLDHPAAPGREGVPPRAASRSRSCTWTPATTSPR